MAKPRSLKQTNLPYVLETVSRKGTIFQRGDGKFGFYYWYAGKRFQNSANTFDDAYRLLETGLNKLELNPDDANALYHLQRKDIKFYSELEQLLFNEGNGAG